MSDPARHKVVIYFRMFSPYILARINGAAARMPVVGIEGSRRSSVYAWEPLDGEERFERITLFDQAAIEQQPVAESIAATRAVLDAADPDVVCVTGWSFSEALTMLGWAKERGRPAILLSESTAADATRSFWREAVKRRIVSMCDAALVGGVAQRAYVEALGMAPDRVFIGYDAVDNAFFAREAAAARSDMAAVRVRLGVPDRYFLASSRFIAKKNIARLIAAYAMYRQAATGDLWDLVLLGDGDLREVLQEQVAALGLSDAVHFMGFRQYDELPAFYAGAGGFVHVSTVEQWGLVVNEAMAAGLPVIVSNTCGCVGDLVEHGANGWAVDPLDPADIAARLSELAHMSVARRAVMGECSALRVADYGPDRFGGGLADAVAKACADPRRKAGPVSRWLLRLLAGRDTRAGA